MSLLPHTPDPELFFPCHAKIALYRGAKRDGRKILEPDIGCRTTLHAANALAKKIEWNTNGNTVEIDLMKVLVFQQQIKDNYAMLTPDQIESYENHESFGPAIEGVAALVLQHKDRVLKELHSIMRAGTDQISLLKISMKGSGRDQTISWAKCNSALNDSTWQVLGFREEGGFGANPFDESTDRTRVRILHSHSDSGETADRLELGRSYYYTFILKNTKQNDYANKWLRFVVIVPTAQELKEQSREAEKLQSLIEKLSSKPVTKKKATPAEKIDEVVGSMKNAANFIDAIAGGLSAQQKTWKSQGLTEDEVDDRMSKLRPFFAGKLKEILDEIKK